MTSRLSPHHAHALTRILHAEQRLLKFNKLARSDEPGHGTPDAEEVAMAAAYSMDLRSRVLRDADAGLSSKELADRYHVSRAWVDALKQRRRETRSSAPRKQTKFRGRVLAGQEDRLAALIAAQPDATLAELRHALRTSAGLSTLWRAIDRLQFTVKKTVYADEQRRPDVVAARRQWHAWLPLRDVRQYVFLDECGVTTDLLRHYGRSPRGRRLRDHAPFRHWDTHTVVAALRLDGLGAPAVFDGPIDNPSFLAYVEQVGDRKKHFAFDSTACEIPSVSLLFPCSLTILG